MSSLELQALDSNLLLLFINVIVRESEKYLEATFAHLDQDERGQQPPPPSTPPPAMKNGASLFYVFLLPIRPPVLLL